MGKGLDEKKNLIPNMVRLANLTRDGFKNNDISTLMSPRTTITWAENYKIFGSLDQSFILSFLNKCDEADKEVINEYYQRCFGREVLENESQK